MDLQCITFNMHGYENGEVMLLELLKKNADVICLQEHWLYPDELHRLHMDGYTCVAKSGMDCSNKIISHRGRPYGGVAILAKKSLGEPRSVDIDCNRCIAAVVGDSLVVINVYMPCYAPDVAREGLYLETVAKVQDCVETHAHLKYVITGDFNYDLRQANSSYPCRAWGQLMADHSGVLISTGAEDFTYSHDTLGHRSWLDFAITPASICTDECSTIDSHLNFSDHRPVGFVLNMQHSKSAGSNYFSGPSRSQRIFWTESLREEYFYRSLDVLNTLNMPLYTCETDLCKNQEHQSCLLDTYRQIVEGLLRATARQPDQHSGSTGPPGNKKREKPWWSPHLSSLKEEVRLAHVDYSNTPWDTRKKATWSMLRKTFKRAIRAAKAEKERKHCNSLTLKWSCVNKEDFWKEWKHLTSKSKKVAVTTEVIEQFGQTCAEVFKPNNEMHAEHIRKQYLRSMYTHTPNEDGVVITPEDVLAAMRKLKKGKAVGEDGVTVEHLLFASPEIADCLAYVFTGFLGHGVVPEDFQRGLLVPIPKDSRGNMGDVKNFRPICLNSVVLKLFEGIIKVKYASYFVTSSRQFSYKTGSSTTSAVEELKVTVQHYLKDSSAVHCAFLDSSKAFDKVVHEGVLHELVNRHAPNRLLGIIEALITKCVYRVRGCQAVIEAKAGVKQGSILSPLLFNLYMDGLSDFLTAKGLGCFAEGNFRGLFMYADDVALVAPSQGALQAMVDVFDSFSHYRAVKLNVAKSCVLVFGRDQLYSPVTFQGEDLPLVSKTKYLGIELCSSRRQALSCLVDAKLASYYRAANALLCRVRETGLFREPNVQYFLYSRFCIPVISYGLQTIWSLMTKRDKKRLRVAHNSSVRRVFRIGYMDYIPEQYRLEAILDLT